MSTSFETSKSEDVNEDPLLMCEEKFDSLALSMRDITYKIDSPEPEREFLIIFNQSWYQTL